MQVRLPGNERMQPFRYSSLLVSGMEQEVNSIYASADRPVPINFATGAEHGAECIFGGALGYQFP